MTVKIKVELTIKDKTVELTFDEAKALFYQLKPLIDKTQTDIMQNILNDYNKNRQSDSWRTPHPIYYMTKTSLGKTL